jgi:tRNA dimethylallyltransferase
VTDRPPLLVIAGATGVGKTAAAVALGCRVALEVVSADSRQVYRGMDVATGKPTQAERAAVPHHLIDIVEPDDRYQAARFRADAVRAIQAIRMRGRLPAVVGGTGLYIRALLRGLDPAPPADPSFRAELESVAVAEGAVALHRRLATVAPAMARRLHPNDRVRIVRALELVRAGSVLGDEQTRWRTGGNDYDVLYIGLTMERQALDVQVRARARAMAAHGLLDEVSALLARGFDESLPAMRGIGYRQFIAVARGALSHEAAVRAMERETVRYVRRQRTWFAREPGVTWIDVGTAHDPGDVAMTIGDMLKERGIIG